MRIAIDPGHGGDDPGAVAGGVKEKDVALAYSQELAAELAARGHEVMVTRVDDSFVGLSLRAHRSNDWGADCLVSIHANAASNVAANGAWVIYDDRSAPEKGPALARAIFDALRVLPGLEDADDDVEVFADRTAWVGHRDLTVISKAAAPAVLVELGFMTNAADLAQMLRKQDMADICVAIADGIEAWAGIEPVPVVDIEGDEPGETEHLPLGDRRNPIPHPKMVHPLHRPAAEVARPGESMGELLRRTGEAIAQPILRSLWNGLIGWIERRAIEEVDEALDRITGTPERR